VTLARAAGMPLYPWQAEILTESARRQSDGAWSAYEVGAIVPRQNGKSFLIVARALAGALLYNDMLTLYSAHEMRTARDVWNLMLGLCRGDYLEPLVSKVYNNGSIQEITFHNGAKFRMMTRSKTAGRGMSPDCVLFDEALFLAEDVLSAILPAMSARPNPQIWYVSSAGTWESRVLANLRSRGHKVSTRDLAYWEWWGSDEDDVNDPVVWASKNPSYGLGGLGERTIRLELSMLSRKAFQRERLGVWQQSAIEPLLSADDIERLAVPVPQPPTDGRTIGWGLDVSSDRSNAAIAAAFRDDEGIPVVTLVDIRGGAAWVLDRLSELDQAYSIDTVAFDAKGNIVDLMERLDRDYSIGIQPLRQVDYTAACAAFAQHVTEGTVRIGRAPALISDCGAASARTFTGGWVWDRKTPTPPTALIAATDALYSLEHGEGGRNVSVY
jgi:phage terminase large subunit-like protein